MRAPFSTNIRGSNSFPTLHPLYPSGQYTLAIFYMPAGLEKLIRVNFGHFSQDLTGYRWNKASMTADNDKW